MTEIQKNAQRKINRETDDPKLASIVAKLLTFTNDPNDFEVNEDENGSF